MRDVSIRSLAESYAARAAAPVILSAEEEASLAELVKLLSSQMVISGSVAPLTDLVPNVSGRKNWAGLCNVQQGCDSTTRRGHASINCSSAQPEVIARFVSLLSDVYHGKQVFNPLTGQVEDNVVLKFNQGFSSLKVAVVDPESVSADEAQLSSEAQLFTQVVTHCASLLPDLWDSALAQLGACEDLEKVQGAQRIEGTGTVRKSLAYGATRLDDSAIRLHAAFECKSVPRDLHLAKAMEQEILDHFPFLPGMLVSVHNTVGNGAPPGSRVCIEVDIPLPKAPAD